MPKVDSKAAELARFFSAYQKLTGLPPTLVQHRDRPDFELAVLSCTSPFGLEVCGAYQDETEAKIMYWAVPSWDQFEGDPHLFLGAFNCRIADTSAKSHTYDYPNKMHLAIWLGSMLFSTTNDVAALRPAIVVPPNAFTHIWLIDEDPRDYSPVLLDIQ